MDICSKKKTKIIYDIADFYGDSYVSQEMSFLRPFVSKIERILTRSVNAAIIADELRTKQMCMDDYPFNVIYNSPPDTYRETKSRLISSKSNPKLTLFYAGVLENDRGLDFIVRAVHNMSDVELIIAGFGRLENEILNLIKGSDNISFLGRIPYHTVLDLASSSDCIIAFYDPKIQNNLFASPNKLFEAMMCGKPIITNSGTTMANRINIDKCGFLVTYGNVNELRYVLNTVNKYTENYCYPWKKWAKKLSAEICLVFYEM